jgi:hypothetical protein
MVRHCATRRPRHSGSAAGLSDDWTIVGRSVRTDALVPQANDRRFGPARGAAVCLCGILHTCVGAPSLMTLIIPSSFTSLSLRNCRSFCQSLSAATYNMAVATYNLTVAQ